ncbi:MAG: hypothetical protein F6J93_17335 [Oscillatoria sp. SIO1A7]|nr:hypothetical protein [Oscillatoria sp. SIO1A7]
METFYGSPSAPIRPVGAIATLSLTVRGGIAPDPTQAGVGSGVWGVGKLHTTGLSSKKIVGSGPGTKQGRNDWYSWVSLRSTQPTFTLRCGETSYYFPTAFGSWKALRQQRFLLFIVTIRAMSRQVVKSLRINTLPQTPQPTPYIA